MFGRQTIGGDRRLVDGAIVPSSDIPWSLDVGRHTIWLMGFSISLMSDKHVAYKLITHVQESSRSEWYFHLTFLFFQAYSFS